MFAKLISQYKRFELVQDNLIENDEHFFFNLYDFVDLDLPRAPLKEDQINFLNSFLNLYN